jgi:serine/threonine protein kinase/tetratricopeptide (TPR) repeat protein
MNERDLFIAALQKDEESGRRAFLDDACGADATLRRKVEDLLSLHGKAARFLEPPGVAPTIDREPIEVLGTSIGPYKLMEAIGEGGMGVVYVAEQHRPVRRKVALKVIKPGMDTKQVVARFEAERQALAMMDHPNIAKVHDGGATEGGHPYFVMELVRGIPITDYCDRERLSIPERLELFVQVCRAVQHAHLKGVIHRDLKPSNILVTVIDGAAVPKVIDFGVAKATGGSLTERTIYTAFQQFLGTPLYMSPEQADLSGTDVDTRSDIYSLGVLLYELLTGTTPFDRETFGKAAFDEIRRILREEEPPRPSTRLSSLGETRTAVSANRRADARHLDRAVRGELDWVVMKALEKDRRRRYETANDFAADVTRHLTDRPVEACPPSAWYRSSKYARRHRAALTTAALVGLALVAGTAVSTGQAIRAQRAGTLAAQREREAQVAAAESKAVLEFLVRDLLGASELEKALGRDVRMSEVLANAEKKLDSAFPDQPLVEAGVRHALATTFSSLGRYEVAWRHGSRAHDLRLRLLGPEHPDTMTSLHTLAGLLVRLDKWEEARKLSEQSVETRRRVLGPEHPDTLASMNILAKVLDGQEKLDEARTLHEQTLEIRRRVRGPKHPDTLESMNNLAYVLMRQGKHDEARTLLEKAVEISRLTLGLEHPLTLTSMSGLGIALASLGKHDEARTLLEKVVEVNRRTRDPEHPSTLFSMDILAGVLLASRDAPDRLRALELTRHTVESIPSEQIHWKWLSAAEYRNGHWEAAIRAAEKCIELRKKGWAFHWVVLALAHARRGEMDRARAWYDKARPAIEGGKGLYDTPRWLIAEAVSLLGGEPPQGEAKPNTGPESTSPPK